MAIMSSRSKSPSSSRNGKSKSSGSSPRSDKELLKSMGEDAFHQSFCRLPNEEPVHKWNTDEAEEHIQRMKKLDKKLQKANDDIARLKEMLQKADEKCEAQLERYAKREERALEDITDIEEQQRQVEKQSMSTTIQFDKLQAKLQANYQKMKDLRVESKLANKELRKLEKQMDKLKFHNVKLEESSADLFASYSDLCQSKVFEDSNVLHDILEEGKEQFAANKESVAAMQERYMGQAQQRLQLQQTMAEMMNTIQGALAVKNPQLANAISEIGLETERQATALMKAVQAEHGD